MTIWEFATYSFLFIFVLYLMVTLWSETKAVKQTGSRPDRSPLKVFPKRGDGLSGREFAQILEQDTIKTTQPNSINSTITEDVLPVPVPISEEKTVDDLLDDITENQGLTAEEAAELKAFAQAMNDRKLIKIPSEEKSGTTDSKNQ